MLHSTSCSCEHQLCNARLQQADRLKPSYLHDGNQQYNSRWQSSTYHW